MAPFAKGQVFGSVTISLDGKPLAKRPLEALSAVELGGIVHQFFEEVLLNFE